MRKIFLLCSLMCFPTLGFVQGQDVQVRAELDSVTIWIGEQVHLSLELSKPKGKDLIWPVWSDSLSGAVELVGSQPAKTELMGDKELVKQVYTLTCFDSGLHFIPPFVFKEPGGKQYASNSLALKVLMVPVDTTRGFVDVKAPIAVAYSWGELWPWLLGGFLLLLLLAVTVYVILRVRQKKPVFNVRTERPMLPEQAVMERLRVLREDKVWEKGEGKFFYTELTEALRVYLEDCYGIDAMEMTSDEIIAGARAADFSREAIQLLSEVLKEADLVKFANVAAVSAECEKALSEGEEFVTLTKPVRESALKEEGEAAVE